MPFFLVIALPVRGQFVHIHTGWDSTIAIHFSISQSQDGLRSDRDVLGSSVVSIDSPLQVRLQYYYRVLLPQTLAGAPLR